MRNDESMRRVHFGPFEADFQTQELWEGSTRLKLGRQPFEILEMLVSHPGQLVTREQLQRRLWPEDHFVDASHGLNAVVNKLRDTLHDSADQPQYIETLPRRGYRFIGQVERERTEVQVPEGTVKADEAAHATLPVAAAEVRYSPVVVTGPVAAPRRWPIVVTATAALIVGGAVGIALTIGVSEPAAETQESSYIRPANPEIRERALAGASKTAGHRETSAAPQWRPEAHGLLQPAEFHTIISGAAGNAAPQFSPDGKRIAFMSNRSGPWQIWMSNADGSDAKQVSFTGSAGTPRWSPDGRSLAFDAPTDEGTYVFVAPVDDPKSARPLAEGCVPSFSRDGRFLYFASARTGGWQVWRVPVNGGDEVQITQNGGFAAMESEDGNVYYSNSRFPNPELWKVPVNGGQEVALAPLARPRTWSSWTVTREGILLVSDMPDGKSHLSVYDPAKQTLHELATLQTSPQWMGATADGKRVVMNDNAERQISLLENLP